MFFDFKDQPTFINNLYTSSAVLVTASKPTYEKKTVADPASKPFAPKGRYLYKKSQNQMRESTNNNCHLK